MRFKIGYPKTSEPKQATKNLARPKISYQKPCEIQNKLPKTLRDPKRATKNPARSKISYQKPCEIQNKVFKILRDPK